VFAAVAAFLVAGEFVPVPRLFGRGYEEAG
jgi:hypothetical protein